MLLQGYSILYGEAPQKTVQKRSLKYMVAQKSFIGLVTADLEKCYGC